MKSLQGRLIAMSVGIMLASGLVAGLGGYHAARTEADEILDTQLEQFALTLQFMVGADDIAVSGDIGQSPSPGHSLMVYQVWRLKPARPRVGSIAWSRQHLPDHMTPTLPALVMRSTPASWPLDQDAGSGYRDRPLGNRQFRFFAMNSSNGEFRIEVGEDLIDRDEMVRQIAWNNTWPYLFTLPLGIVALVWFMHRALMPLRKLALELRSRAPGHLAHMDVADMPRELQPVLSALNSLLEQLGHAIENERRFTGDAAHELRTPMAALRAQLDALRLANNKESRIQAQEQAVASLDRMVRLVNQLLILARLDAACVPGSASADASDIATEICRDMAPATLAKSIDLSLHAEPAFTPCDDEDLRILLRNLLDNAIRYTGHGGRIEIRIMVRRDGGASVIVADNGPGISETRRSEIGQRFNRLGIDQPGGSGLGLSIVLRVAERCGASIAFGTGLDLRGLAVRVDYPASGLTSRT